MAQSLIACPLCSAPSFTSTNALCLSLINVASKWLRCTLCEEELRGLDKLTIHLLGHLVHTADFKKCFNTDNTSSDEKSVCVPEPLNLVKSQNDQWNENTSENSKPDMIESSFLQAKMIPDIQNERLSLKIDDEVMIFFNCDDKGSQNKLSEILRVSEKPNEISPLTGLPKFTINFSKDVNKLSEDSIQTEGRNALLSNMYFDPPSSHQIPHFVFAADTHTTCKNDSSSLPDNDHQMDQKEHESCLVEATTTPDSHMYDGSEKRVCNKSSFLSPKGERVLGFRCDICSLVFPDENILTMHRQLIHIELTGDPSETNSFKCHLCSKSFVMKGSLMVHMRVAHFGGAVVARLVEAKQLETNAVSPDSAQYVCSICNKGFKKEQQLMTHEKLHEGKQCDICLKTFTTKYFLRKHKRLHTGEMPYTCSVCNKSFTFQQSYHKHLLYHSDDKPYCCVDCGRAFKELSTLHNHQRIHTGEKPFSCETCGKCFRQRVSYLVHRRIHTGVMPYRCQDCGKTFRYKVSERTHKCAVFTPSADSCETTDPPAADTGKEVLSSVENTAFPRNANGDLQVKDWQQSETLGGPPVSAGDQVMSASYPEPPDFFSLVMSPSDRMQHLSLSTETCPLPETSHDSIDTEALKQLLYDVGDYN